MYGRPFDHKADYGTCHGETLAAFEQGGQLYDAHKRPIDSTGKLMPLKPAAAAPEPVKDSAPPPPPDNPEDDIPEDEKPIDLKAWARGELNGLNWQKVRAAIEAATGTAVANKIEGLAAVKAHYGSVDA